MRLIDVDAMNEKLFYKQLGGKDSLISAESVFDMIRATPTAYDVEKVVAELESFAKLAEDRWVNGTSNHACQEHRCWVKAIEIVRKGGTE